MNIIAEMTPVVSRRMIDTAMVLTYVYPASMQEEKMTFDGEVDRFLAAFAFSVNTKAAYRGDLNRFFRWLDDYDTAFALSEIQESTVDEYIHLLLEDSKRMTRSIGRCVSSLRTFFAWAYESHLTETKIYPNMSFESRQDRKSIYLDASVLDRLCSVPEGETFRSIRDRAMLALLCRCGLNASEIVSINVTAVDLKNRVIIIVKTKGLRKIDLSSDAMLLEALRAYTIVRPVSKTPVFFVTHVKRGMTRQGFWKLVCRHAKSIGLDADVQPRLLAASAKVALEQEQKKSA